MDLVTYRHDEVLIRNQAVLVGVEVVEHSVGLLARYWEAPVPQEKLQLLFLDVRIIVFVEVSESFPDGFPLLPNFVY